MLLNWRDWLMATMVWVVLAAWAQSAPRLRMFEFQGFMALHLKVESDFSHSPTVRWRSLLP